jgi:hypothetical protein
MTKQNGDNSNKKFMWDLYLNSHINLAQKYRHLEFKISNLKIGQTEKKTNQSVQLEAYKILVNMLNKEDTLSWQQNGILFAINGGLLTALGSIQPKTLNTEIVSLNIISVMICLLGVLICIFWHLIANRIESFYNHWYEQLKYLEKTEIESLKIFTIADKFFDEKRINLGEKYFKLRFLSGIIHIFTVIQILTVILIIIWVILGIHFIQKI